MRRRRRGRIALALGLAIALLTFAAGWLRYLPAGPGRVRDTYVEGAIGELQRINPLLVRADDADADLVQLIFAGLMRIAPNGTPLPDLAERWEVTPDGRAYTFHLRPGLAWHDGEPLTAHDVAFTVRSVQAEGFQGPSALATRWAGVEIIVADERTIVLRLPAPSASFLAAAALGIVPEHVLGGLDAAAMPQSAFSRAPIGAGPYQFVRLEPGRAVLEANPFYHLGPPRLRRIELRYYRDERTLAEALGHRAIDGALLPALPAAVTRQAVATRTDLRAGAVTTGGYTALYMNNLRSPLSDPALRRALASGLEHTALAAVTGGLPGDGPFVPGSWVYQPSNTPRGDAAALLDAAGWTLGADGVRRHDGVPLRLPLVTDDSAERLALADAIVVQWRQLGIDVPVEALPEQALLRDRVASRDYALLLFGWTVGADPDPYGAFHTSQIGAGGRNIAGFHDADADTLLERARLTLDSEERLGLYAQFARRVEAAAPLIVVDYPVRTYVHPAALAGVAAGVLFHPALRFRDVHTWHFDGPAH